MTSKIGLIILGLSGLCQAFTYDCDKPRKERLHVCNKDMVTCRSDGVSGHAWNLTRVGNCELEISRTRTDRYGGKEEWNFVCNRTKCPISLRCLAGDKEPRCTMRRWAWTQANRKVDRESGYVRNGRKLLVTEINSEVQRRKVTGNKYLYMSWKYAHLSNVSNCWVCLAGPSSSKGGIPLQSVPFTPQEMAEWLIRQSDMEGTLEESGFSRALEARIWRSTGYTLTTFKGWYQPGYDQSQRPPFMVITDNTKVGEIKGQVCLVGEGTGNWEAGRSICQDQYTVKKQTWQWKDTIDDKFKNTTMIYGSWDVSQTLNRTSGGTWESQVTKMNVVWTNFTTYNGTYFICGHKAYPWLPRNWIGSCYLGYVVPYIHHLPSLADHHHYHPKRAITESERFFAILFPGYGAARAIEEIRLVASILEKVANDTAESLSKINTEMVAMRTVALQNRMALDYLLAEKGGTCAIIGSECCTYIPDDSKEISDLVGHIRREVEGLKKTDSWGQWGFGGWYDWGINMAIYLGIGILCIFICLALVKCLLAKMGDALTTIGTPRTMVQTRGNHDSIHLEQEFERLNNILLE